MTVIEYENLPYKYIQLNIVWVNFYFFCERCCSGSITEGKTYAHFAKLVCDLINYEYFAVEIIFRGIIYKFINIFWKPECI